MYIANPALANNRRYLQRLLLPKNKAATLLICFFVGLMSLLWLKPIRAQEGEPIAIVGHGGFFDQKGNEIPLSLGFAEKAQVWYRGQLMKNLASEQKSAFAAYEKRLYGGMNAKGQNKLIIQHQAIEWLLANTKLNDSQLQMLGKLSALRYAMNWKLPEQGSLKVVEKRETFTLPPDMLKHLESLPFRPAGDLQVLSATINSGQAYIDECRAAGVPIPPTINRMDPAGLTGWKSQGFIPQSDLFIEAAMPAEIRTYKSTSPEGMCYALPRYLDASLSTVQLDGVICMGKQSSKACFWDNQEEKIVKGEREFVGFSFAAGEQIPIGVPNTLGGRYQAGGKEIENGSGGRCTSCHLGENPFIVHPMSNLGVIGSWENLSGAPQNLPTMPVNRYDPIVANSWQQNRLSHAGLPAQCISCHVKGGSGGRLPHLSRDISLPNGDDTYSYCTTILTKALNRTMPPGSPVGSESEVGKMLLDFCENPPNASVADSGDPHITTTNGINYDFQAAGEFTVLKNSDTGFELQTRQSPVLTLFTPLKNSYTELSSCVSLNTAAALRIGKHRITYQLADGKRLELRVDGELIKAENGADLGDGNVINKANKEGEVDIRLADGSRVVIIPTFWASQGYWYLDVRVLNTSAREGVMGPVLVNDWLPRAPDGTSFGPKPTSLLDRDVILNHKFADAWRVNDQNSLFDYTTNTSTKDFTDINWPPESGKACNSTTVGGIIPVVKEPRPDLAKKACSGIKNKTIFANCIFDVTVLGDTTAANGHQRANRLNQ